MAKQNIDPENRNQCPGAGSDAPLRRDAEDRAVCPICQRKIKVSGGGKFYRHQQARSPELQKALNSARRSKAMLRKAGAILQDAPLSDYERDLVLDMLTEIREVAEAGKRSLSR